MKKACKGISKTLMIIVLVAVVASTSIAYSLLTYPRIMVSFPVSFTFGADVERREFNIPILHDSAQVEVIVANGNLLWTARILSGDNVLWNHGTHQGD